jgi:HTH-type transcriptional regulator, competence development regulator
MDFGSRIRQLRKAKNISLRDFADIVEIDFTYLSKIENGKVDPPSEKKIRLIARELGVNQEELLDLAGKVSPEKMRKAVEGNPNIGLLLRRIESRKLTNSQINDMLNIASGNDDEDGESA